MLVNRRELLNEMKKIVKMVSGSYGSRELIKGVLIEYKGGELKLSATDLITSIVTKLICETDMMADEAFVVDAKLLHDIINKLSSETVKFTFDREETTLKIVGGRSKFNIRSSGGKKDFPNFEIELRDKKTITIPSEVFVNLVNKTIRFTSDDDSRPVLQGVNILFKKGSITGISLDGYRMAYYVSDIECDHEVDMIIRNDTLASISSSIDSDEVLLSYSENSKQLEFVLGKTAIYSSIVEGQFFDYKSILKPDEVKTTLTVTKKALKSSVDRASIVAKSSASMNPIVFSVDENELIIKSDNEIGKVEERVEIGENEGEKIDYKIAFNSKYILDGVNSISSESIEFKLDGELQPAYLVDKDIGYIYLALPIRLNS